MVHDLDLALAISTRFRERKVVVNEAVFMEALDQVISTGAGRAVMNIPQASSKYPFVHQLAWRGITLVHFSREAVQGTRT
jgi:hypothetical protein